MARELVEIEASKGGRTVAGLRVLDAAGPAGIEALMADPQGVLLRLRVYVFDDDTLEMAVIGNLDLVASAEADRFLGSLLAVP